MIDLIDLHDIGSLRAAAPAYAASEFPAVLLSYDSGDLCRNSQLLRPCSQWQEMALPASLKGELRQAIADCIKR
jgi:hypothetical protein